MITTIPQPAALENHPAQVTPSQRALLWLAGESRGSIYVLNPTLETLDLLAQNVQGREIVAVDPTGAIAAESPLGVHVIQARAGDFQETFPVGLVVMEGDLDHAAVQQQASSLIEGLTHAGQEDVVILWTGLDARRLNGTFQIVERLPHKVRHLAGTNVAFTVWAPRHKRALLA